VADTLTPGPEIQRLLFTDFDGRPADPDSVVNEAFDDPRHAERVPRLVAVLRDPAAKPYDRFMAAYALTKWGEEAGYRAVREAAEAPDGAPWIGYSIDRRFQVDDTFAQLAEAVGDSEELADAKGTDAARLEALRSLVRIADSTWFDRNLAGALDRRSLPAVLDEIPPVVARALPLVTEHRDRLAFDLATQLAGLAGAVVTVDEPLAVRLADAIVDADPGPRALRELTDVVGRGTGEESLILGERLRLGGTPEVAAAVDEALASRAWRAERR
jgi:hypothetical protein